MRGLGMVVGLVGALGLTNAQGAAPPADPVSDCIRACGEAGGSETDQATCRLQCREAETSRTTPNRVEWRRTELKGGSPDPTMPAGTTTTVIETSPSGTTETTTHDRRMAKSKERARSQSTTPRPGSGSGKAWCRLGCALPAAPSVRLECWARCSARE